MSPNRARQSLIALRAGLNFATLGSDDSNNPDSRTGLNLGASYLIPVSTNVGIHLGVAYSQKRAKDDDIELALDYLEVSTLLNLGLLSSGSVSAHALIGPAIGVEVGCEATGFKYPPPEGWGTVTADCSDFDVNTTVHWGVVVGAGMLIGLTDRVSALVDLSYSLGATSIDDAILEFLTTRALTLQAGVGISVGN